MHFCSYLLILLLGPGGLAKNQQLKIEIFAKICTLNIYSQLLLNLAVICFVFSPSDQKTANIKLSAPSLEKFHGHLFFLLTWCRQFLGLLTSADWNLTDMIYSKPNEFIQNRTEIEKIFQCALYCCKLYKVQIVWGVCLCSVCVSIVTIMCRNELSLTMS